MGTKQSVSMGEAVAAAKLGRTALARQLLREIVEDDARNEQAWFLLAALAESTDEAETSLRKVLEINPGNLQAMNVLGGIQLTRARERMEAADRRAKMSAPQTAPETIKLAPEPPKPVVRPDWTCPICGAQTPAGQRECSGCGSISSLTNLEELSGNRKVNDEAVLASIQRLLEAVEKRPSHEGHLALAYAYLNLNRSAEALPQLKSALTLRPGVAVIERAIQRLENQRLILAVDDSMTVRKLLSISLEKLGYRVISAADGMHALARLNEETPDLILLDITMPRMDGYQVCKVIRQNPFTKNIPVLMLSGKDGFFDKVKGRLAGATDYLTKPLPEDKLAKAVSRYLVKNA